MVQLGRRRLAVCVGIGAVGLCLLQSTAAQALPIESTEGWAIYDDDLYALDYSGHRTVLNDGWMNSAWMVFDGTATLHIVQWGVLYKASGIDGHWHALGPAQWGGTSFAAWNQSTGSLYVVQNNYLQRLNNPYVDDAYSVLGGAIWDGTTAMTSRRDKIYIIRNGSLYLVDPNTGSRAIIGNAGDWTGSVKMTAFDQTREVMIVQNTRLYGVDRFGQWRQVGTTSWYGTSSIFSFLGNDIPPPGAQPIEHMGIFKGSKLYKVEMNGSSEQQGVPPWGATISAGKIPMQ